MGVLIEESSLLSDDFLEIYEIYRHVVTVLSVVSVAITVFIIVKASTRALSIYRWFLLADLACALAYDFLANQMGLVSLFPIPCVYTSSWLKEFGFDLQMVYLIMLALLLIVWALFTVFLLLYRFFLALPHDSSVQKVNFTKAKPITQFVLLGSFSMVTILLCLGPVLYHLPNQVEFQHFLRMTDPVMGELLGQYPNTLCLTDTLDLTSTLFLGSFFILLCPVLGIAILVLSYYYIRRGRRDVTQSTYRLQVMLFTSLSTHILCVFSFIILPNIYFFVMPTFGFPNKPMENVIALMFSMSHSPFNCAITIYFIKPYRDYFSHVFLRRTRSKSMVVSGDTTCIQEASTSRI